MRSLIAAIVVALATTACAPVETAPKAPADPLALHADKRIPADINAAFAAGIAARFAGARGAEEVSGELSRAGFICTQKGAYPEIKAGEILAVCELPKPHGLCSDKWTVTLTLRAVTRALDFHRVTTEGAFSRFCIAGASPDG